MAKEKKFDLIEYTQETNNDDTIEYDKEKYIVLPKELQDCFSLEGCPLGHCSLLYGLSDSGKTECLLHVAANAIKCQVLPIIIITENKFKEDRLSAFGLEPGKNCIIKRDLHYLEDVYDFISQKIHHVKENKLNTNVIILWDSVASTPSKESMEFTKDGKIKKKFGPQKNASVIGYYNPIILDLISSTRIKGSKYQVGLFMVTQGYVYPSLIPGIPPTIVPNGGEKVWFNLSLAMEIKEGTRLKVKKEGKEFAFGLTSSIKTVKNHLNGVYSKNKVVFVNADVIPATESAITKYKKENQDSWNVDLSYGNEDESDA